MVALNVAMAPLSVQSEGVQKFLTDYKAKYPKGQPSSNGSLYAYAGAQIADAGLRIVREELHVTGTVRRLPFLKKTLTADGLIRDVFISNMEYVLAHAGA